MKPVKFLIGWLLVMFIWQNDLQAQNDFLQNLKEEERKSIEALVLYPSDIRLAILEISTEPTLLVKIRRIQENSKEAFSNLLVSYDQTTQEAIWDLSRYPGLLSVLASMERWDESQLSNYPQIIYERAKSSYFKELTLVREAAYILNEAEYSIADLSKSYSEKVQQALEMLVNHPEVMTILVEEIELSIEVGDLYLNNPERVIAKADSLHEVLAEENAKAFNDWKHSIEDDQTAKDELLAAVDDYKEEYSYDDTYYDYEEYQGVDEIPLYYYYHYPFWFGTPHWYVHRRWRPLPYWIEWGIYHRIGYPIVVVHYPTIPVIEWYLQYPHHHYRYTHLSKTIINYYYGHREFGNNITAGVDRWKDRNRTVTDDWLKENDRLEGRLREFGKMEEARERYNKRNPEKSKTQLEYLEQNKRRYPKIASKAPATDKSVRNKPNETLQKTAQKPLKVRKPIIQREPIKKETKVREIDRAKDYHKSKWSKTPAKPAPSKTTTKKATVKPAKKSPRSKPVKKKEN